MRLKKKIIELTQELIKAPEVREWHNQCVSILNKKNAPVRLYFELHHEFGHVSHAFEKGATLIYVKIEKHLFSFNGSNITYKKNSGKSSHTLLYFNDTFKLSERWIHAIKGGLYFSSEAKKIKTRSYPINRFNRLNSLGSRIVREGSDAYLYEMLKAPQKALDFNREAIQLADEFYKVN